MDTKGAISVDMIFASFYRDYTIHISDMISIRKSYRDSYDIYQSRYVFASFYRDYMIHISDMISIRKFLSGLYDTHIGHDKYSQVLSGFI